tara:strand:- start:2004 stop:2303 length:300 start_codon:yes stop_codon:yes gene_type:complete
MDKRRHIAEAEECMQDAIQNIKSDRALAMKLLTDLMTHIKTDDTKHQYFGPVAAKYLETLQRSNEQLVKITGLMHKKSSQDGLSKKDKEELFDLINSQD